MSRANKPTSSRTRETLTSIRNIALPNYTYYGMIPFTADGELQVYDGDTVRLVIDLGMEHWSSPVYYRLLGIQAPEVRPLINRVAGIAARDHLRKMVAKYFVWQNEADFPGHGYGVIVRTHKKLRKKTDYRPRACRGKFGRWLVEIFGITESGDTINFNNQMVIDGQADIYVP